MASPRRHHHQQHHDVPILREIQRRIVDKDYIGLLDLCEELELEGSLMVDAIRLQTPSGRLPPPPSAAAAPVLPPPAAAADTTTLTGGDLAMDEDRPTRADTVAIADAGFAAGGVRSSTPSSDSNSPTRQPQRAPVILQDMLLHHPPTSPSAKSPLPATTSSFSALVSLDQDSTELALPADPRLPPLLLLAHLLAGQVDQARFAVRRAPPAARASQEYQALVAVAEQLHARNAGGALRLLAASQAAHLAALKGESGAATAVVWSSPLIAVLVQELGEVVRAREARLLERAYESVEVAWAAKRLAMAEDEAVAWARATRPAWEFVPAGGASPALFRIAKGAGADGLPDAAAIGAGPGLMQIADLAGYIVHMERS
ncbi:hypothetical protein DFJ73DRAFT_777246 [Zopfochytrium polystomum]|nr:hypothetical protein DFJ73DRAFT_777246 [Zopfochytrium polystomum]